MSDHQVTDVEKMLTEVREALEQASRGYSWGNNFYEPGVDTEKLQEEWMLKLEARLDIPCSGCPGCATGDCPDALDVAATTIAALEEAAIEHRDCKVEADMTSKRIAELEGERDAARRHILQLDADLDEAIAERDIALAKLEGK